MGAVFRPKDLGSGNRKVIENAVRTLAQTLRIVSLNY